MTYLTGSTETLNPTPTPHKKKVIHAGYSGAFPLIHELMNPQIARMQDFLDKKKEKILQKYFTS